MGPTEALYALNTQGTLFALATGATGASSLQADTGIAAIAQDANGTLYKLSSGGSLYDLLATGSGWTLANQTVNSAPMPVIGIQATAGDPGIEVWTADGNDWFFNPSGSTPWTLKQGPQFSLVCGLPTTNVRAGKEVPFALTVENDLGQLATDYTGTVQFNSSDAAAGLPSDYPFTASDNGSHPFTATLVTAGAQTLAVSDVSGAATSGEASITVNPGPFAALAVSVGPTAIVGNPVQVTVSAEDAYGNVVPTYGGTVTLSSTTGQSWPGYAYSTADAGAHVSSIILDAVGYQQITATDQATDLPGTAGLLVGPAAADPADSTVLVTPTTITAGGTATVTLTARDAYGNQETSGGLPVDFGLISFGGQGTMGPVVDNGDGTYSATFTAGQLAGSNMVLAVMNGYVLPLPWPTISITPPPGTKADTVTLTDWASPSTYGQQLTLTAVVAATAGGATPTGTVVFEDNGQPLPGTSTVPLANGTASFGTATLSVGNQSITAVYSGDATFAAGTSAVDSHQVSPSGSATTTTSGTTAAQLGQPVPFL